MRTDLGFGAAACQAGTGRTHRLKRRRRGRAQRGSTCGSRPLTPAVPERLRGRLWPEATKRIEYGTRVLEGKDNAPRRRMFIGHEPTKGSRAASKGARQLSVLDRLRFGVAAFRPPLATIATFSLLSLLPARRPMGTNASPAVLLRRIAHLEAAVGRLTEDLESLRRAVSRHGFASSLAGGLRSQVARSPGSCPSAWCKSTARTELRCAVLSEPQRTAEWAQYR